MKNILLKLDSATMAVNVKAPGFPEVGAVPGFPNQPYPSFPETGAGSDLKIIAWEILLGVLVTLIIVFFSTRKRKSKKTQKKE